MNFVLVLGCQEHQDESGFTYCSHLSNIILDIDNVSSENKEEVINFFDRACNLFDKPCYDYNKIVNIVNYLYKKYNVISENLLKKIQKLFYMYKEFGMFLILVPKDLN